MTTKPNNLITEGLENNLSLFEKSLENRQDAPLAESAVYGGHHRIEGFKQLLHVGDPR